MTIQNQILSICQYQLTKTLADDTCAVVARADDRFSRAFCGTVKRRSWDGDQRPITWLPVWATPWQAATAPASQLMINSVRRMRRRRASDCYGSPASLANTSVECFQISAVRRLEIPPRCKQRTRSITTRWSGPPGPCTDRAILSSIVR